MIWQHSAARLAQSVERETLNLKVVGSTPTSGSIPDVQQHPLFLHFSPCHCLSNVAIFLDFFFGLSKRPCVLGDVVRMAQLLFHRSYPEVTISAAELASPAWATRGK